MEATEVRVLPEKTDHQGGASQFTFGLDYNLTRGIQHLQCML
jgi:hypothetical protein